MFWPDCPFDIYVCSEEKDFKLAWVKNIKVGKKAGWGEMLLYVLDKIDTPNVIYLQEDYLLKGETNNQELNHLLSIFEKLNAAYLRLLPWPGPDLIHTEYPEVGICLPESRYRTSLQAAVWDKEVLKEVTLSSDDGRFESWSIKRAEKLNRDFLCVTPKSSLPNVNEHPSYSIDYFATGVFQGKWLKECIKVFKPLGIGIDTSHRKVMTRFDFFKYALRRKKKLNLVQKVVKKLIC